MVAADPECPKCRGEGWVCEAHPHRGWLDGKNVVVSQAMLAAATRRPSFHRGSWNASNVSRCTAESY